MGKKSSISAKVPIGRELSLEKLITDICPDLTEELVEKAVDQLIEAADSYREEFKSKRGDRLHRPYVSEDRAVLTEILNSTQDALSAIGVGLPYGARRALWEVGLSDADVKAKLADVARAARAALDSLVSVPNRVPDDARAVLAFDVAAVLAGTLGIEPSLSRPSEINASGGALGTRGAYHRLFEATLRAAGAAPPTDLMPWMRLGRKLDPDCADLE